MFPHFQGNGETFWKVGKHFCLDGGHFLLKVGVFTAKVAYLMGEIFMPIRKRLGNARRLAMGVAVIFKTIKT